ncbi:MAG TPA: GNAT family N-acetyltransferase [Mycobacteriales bacterium]|jgi:predicted GNAT family acetyltransferase|nr:GNAT family N-acetyltransferase [Mycobacteriales bacterium]
MRVRRIEADEWERWREFRLGMLADAPYAFGTTLAHASTSTEDEWRERTTRMATTEDQIMFLAEAEDGTWLASAGGYIEDDGIPNVFSVWTRPDARGHGYADACVRSVVEWARRRGAREVRLWATDTNEAARRVYDRIGFVPTGTTQPLPSDPSLTESEYALPL